MTLPFDLFCPVHFFNHEWHVLKGPPRDVIDPATLKVVGRIADPSARELEDVLQLASAAQVDWAALDAKSRANYLHKLANHIEAANPQIVAALMSREMGKPYAEAVGEMANIPSVFRYYAELARDDGGQVGGTTQAGSFQYQRYFPYGVSLHILPYNFPLLLMAWTVAASLAAGNAVVIKPAEASTLTTLTFMQHFCVLPPGLVACVPGGASVAQSLIASDRIHAVAFTGSVTIGAQVAQACVGLYKPCVIEAGGNDPLIVMGSAPIDIAAAGTATAAFHLSGQICTSAERIFVHESIHDAFVEALVARARALRIGNGLAATEIGPLVSEAARKKVIQLIESAIAGGARLECGGRIPPEHPIGWFFEPTVLTGVTPDMAIMNTEVFGPVAPICKVRDFDEAIRLANHSRFGLGASIFTTRLDEAMAAIERLEAGMVWVNNPLIDNDAISFGGWKQSGLGRSLGRLGLDAFRRSKMAVVDPVPALQSWWYPYPESVFFPGEGNSTDC
jgi:acyl-CoA reductase-like NAD-dependent aldehyde dehydrogenase